MSVHRALPNTPTGPAIHRGLLQVSLPNPDCIKLIHALRLMLKAFAIILINQIFYEGLCITLRYLQVEGTLM